MRRKIYSTLLLTLLVACSAPSVKIGVCAGLGGALEIDPDSTGCSFVEVSVTGTLVPESPDSVFATILKQVEGLRVPVLSANCFFPGDIRLVGPDVDTARIGKYVAVALKRANRLGIRTVVLGSGSSRRIQDGVDRKNAKEQFIGLCRMIASVAAENGIVIVLEPLNHAETNFVNTTLEGAEIVREVGHPNFRLLADFFHMARAGENPYQNLVAVKDCLHHCHIAEKENRTPPGVVGDDFSPYFRALKDISYKGYISIECSGLQDMGGSLKSAIDYTKIFE